jgi:hypothetical protein
MAYVRDAPLEQAHQDLAARVATALLDKALLPVGLVHHAVLEHIL